MLLLLLWRWCLGPSITGFTSRSVEDKMYLENSAVTLWISLVAPVFAGHALCTLSLSPLAAPTDSALIACGVSLGYMVYDVVWLVLHPSHDAKQRPLVYMHHILSIVGFPFAMLRHKCVIFVCFFILTEVTGLLQHTWVMLNHFGLKEHPATLGAGVCWMLSFILVRIAPAPYLVYTLVDPALWARFPIVEFWFAVCTVPLPFLLNAYWGYLLVAGAIKAVRKQKQSETLV